MIAAIKTCFEALALVLDERERRLFAASEARATVTAGWSRYRGQRRLRAARSIAASPNLRNAVVTAFQAAGQPVISVDTKTKELVGDFKNGGHELRPKGKPEPVGVHDFIIPGRGKAALRAV